MTNEFKKQTIAYILGAFGLVAGLAWNDAIRATIEFFWPLDQNGLMAKFIYATVLTIVLVLVSTHLSRPEEKK